MAAFQGRPYDFNSYAAGNKTYGFGRSNPTDGPVDKLGYRERDAKHAARRNAILRRLKATQSGNYNSPDFLGGPHA